MKKALIFSPVATHPPHRGNRQRILQTAKLLRQSGYSLELAVGSNRPITEDAREFWDVIHRLRTTPGWKPSHKLAPLDSWYTAGLGEELADLVDQRNIDVVLMNYVFHSRALEFLPNSVVTVIDTHDAFANRHALYEGKRFAGGFFSCTLEDEATYVARADITLAITAQEGNCFRTIQAASKVFPLPFVMERVPLTRSRDAHAGTLKSFAMVLSANDLNLASLSDFIRSVDRQFGRKPPFTVHVAGGIDKFAYRYFPHRIPAFWRGWLTYHGEVNDLDAFYQSVDAIVVPVIAGSGMAIKFAEALSRDLPVISTAAGSRGHTTKQPLHLLPDNSSLVEAIGGIDTADLEALEEESKLCHAATFSTATANWGEVMNSIGDSLRSRVTL